MKKIVFTMATLSLVACTQVPSQIDGRQAFFAFDSAEISKDARKELKKQALYLKKNPDTQIIIEGHCDERGSSEYNLALGALRAGNAEHAIIQEGVESERIKTISYGKENPIYPGTGEEVWAKNRNATTVVKK
ncbi:MAG: OmpA family protein [Alphaproteobacteria bacterium]|nr:OmpA family protein [Alphaproteobacteria bacterium]